MNTITDRLKEAVRHRSRCDQSVVDAANTLRIAQREQIEANQLVGDLTVIALTEMLGSEHAARSVLTTTIV